MFLWSLHLRPYNYGSCVDFLIIIYIITYFSSALSLNPDTITVTIGAIVSLADDSYFWTKSLNVLHYKLDSKLRKTDKRSNIRWRTYVDGLTKMVRRTN